MKKLLFIALLLVSTNLVAQDQMQTSRMILICDHSIVQKTQNVTLYIFEDELHIKNENSIEVFKACKVQKRAGVMIYTCSGVEIMIYKNQVDIIYGNREIIVYKV